MFKKTFTTALVSTLALAAKKTPEDIGYFRGTKYRAKSAIEKLNDLWAQSQADKSVWDIPYNLVDDFFADTQMNGVTCQRNDELKGRTKLLHGWGVVGLAKWEDLGGHSFTGLFDGGSDKALIRLSEANMLLPESTGLTPSFAIKFLRDGMESVNLFGAASFEQSDSWDFFANDFSNRIDIFENPTNVETIQFKFTEVTRQIGLTGLGEFSRFTEDGTLVENHEMPFKLIYKPTAAVSGKFPSTRQYDGEGNEIQFFDQLQTIPEGTTLFEVWAHDIPTWEEGGTFTHIANVKLESDLITSAFGDQRLSFQHETLRFDKDAHPEWRWSREGTVSKADAFDKKAAKALSEAEAEAAEAAEEASEPGRRNLKITSSFAGNSNLLPEDPVEAMGYLRGSYDQYSGCPFAWLVGMPVDPINN